MPPLNNKKFALSGLLALAISTYGAISFACCSLDPAEFSNTIGWVGEGIVNDKIVHILGYQNNAVNKTVRKVVVQPVAAPKSTTTVTGPGAKSNSGGNGNAPTKPPIVQEVVAGNAMLLPIPSRTHMSSANFVDTSKYKNVLQDMQRAVEAPSRSSAAVNKTSKGEVQVFSKGNYTVVLASNAELIPDALSRVPAEKRPRINKEIFSAYQKWYPGFTFALCCFKDSVKGNDPLIWWYEPRNPHSLFFPALDAHDGRPPNLGAEVEVDHTLIVSSDKMKHWTANTPFSDLRKVTYSARPPKGTVLGNLLPDVVAGRHYKGRLSNGDFVFETGDVRGGRCNPMRKLPPGAGGGETHVPGID